MSIYDLPVPGTARRRSIYDTGYAAPPVGLGNLPELAAPTVRVGNGAAQGIYGSPNLPPIQEGLPPGPVAPLDDMVTAIR